MLKVLLADDEPGILSLLEGIISSISELKIVAKAQSIEEARNCFMETEPDIVILDIQFPDGSGVELAREFTKLDPEIDIVFVTAHPGFTLEAFELYSYDYILKPVDESRVCRTIMQIKRERENLPESSLVYDNALIERNIKFGIRVENEILLLDSQDILYIERLGKSVLIHTLDKVIETKETLINLENKLRGQFFRSHRACLVNINKIEKIVLWSENAYQIKFKQSTKEAFLSRRRSGELLQLFEIIG
ncbi:MAG: LytTR family DNA-binding domain-containing protein [Peptococcia bacterium]